MSRQCQNLSLVERYLDGELGAAKRTKFDQHLKECSACSNRLASLQLGADLLREDLEQALENVNFAGFDERVLAAIAKQQPLPLLERIKTWFGETAYHYRAIWLTSLATTAILLAILIPMLGSQAPVKHIENTPPPKEVVAAKIDNEVIIDSMEYAGQRSMIFNVSKNNTTVIWMYDFGKNESQDSQGDEI